VIPLYNESPVPADLSKSSSFPFFQWFWLPAFPCVV